MANWFLEKQTDILKKDIFFLFVSGRYPENPTIGFAPGSGRIFSDHGHAESARKS